MARDRDLRQARLWRADRPQYFPSVLDRAGEEDGLSPARGIGVAVGVSLVLWVGILVAAWLMELF